MAMKTNILNSRTPSQIILLSHRNPSTTIRSLPSLRSWPQKHARPVSIKSVTSDNNSSNTASNDDAPPPKPSPEGVEIRFRRGSRKRRQEKKDAEATKAQAQISSAPPKKWEDMDVKEKAVELYVGEKGLLYWLNKFAYASIYIVIGGWILFRFVGPSLNLYQLDTPPLAPAAIFKG